MTAIYLLHSVGFLGGFFLISTLLLAQQLEAPPAAATVASAEADVEAPPKEKSPLELELEGKVAVLVAKGEKRAAEFNQRGKELEKDAKEPVKFHVTVTMKNRPLSLDLPQVAMRTKKMSMDAPQVTMKTKRIVFDTPSVRMVNKKVGQYPEFRGFTVKWKDIITKVPETFMERQEISFDIPETKWGRTEWSLDIPEVKMATTHFAMKLPEINDSQINLGIPLKNDGVKEDAAKLKQEAEQFAAEMKAEADALSAEYEKKFREQALGLANTQLATAGKTVADKSVSIEEQFYQPIASLDKTIAEKGGKVPASELEVLKAERALLVAKKEAALAPLKEEQGTLDTEQKKLKQQTENATHEAEAEAAAKAEVTPPSL